MMTRKHYIEIARILNENADGIAPGAHEKLVEDFSRWLKQDNPRFDRYRFENASAPKS